MKPNSAEPKAAIPKTLWMLWYQGFDNAPEVVKACHASWVERNPGWTVNFLDETNFRDFVAPEFVERPGQRAQARANLIRMTLLTKHGGVWADATCFCQTPLDDWLIPQLSSGFFAFERTGSARQIDNWFLASSPGNYLTTTYAAMSNGYWRDNPELRRRPKITRYFDKLLAHPSRTKYWFTLPVTKWLKAYPYNWHTFLFTKLINKDPKARQIWNDTFRYSVAPPHRLQEAGLLNPLTPEIKREIDSRMVPLYKLDWRIAKAGIPQGSILDYILSQTERPREQ